MVDAGATENSTRSHFLERMNGIMCIRTLIVSEIVFNIMKIAFSGIVLFITRNITLEEPLKAFLAGYMLICAAKSLVFFSKNKVFFNINSYSEYEESNNDISVVNNLIEGCNLFWYIIGFHWLQQCPQCKDLSPLLYYTCYTLLILGFIAFIGPLIAIVALLILVHYIKPTLKTISFKSVDDVPDGNTRCVICYENYSEGCTVKFLPCEHHFHSECIDEWLNVQDNCPLCKKSINMLIDVIESNENVV